MGLNELLTPVALGSLSATAIMAVISYLLARHLTSRFKLPKADTWVVCWLLWDAMIHFLVEGPFVVLSVTGTVEASNHWTALLWKEYGRADVRWLRADATIVSLELLTVLVDGPLCLLLVDAVCRRHAHRHFIQITLCVCELYGGWMTFCPDWLVGSPSLVTDDWLLLWIYLVFFNGLWVLVPGLLLLQSWYQMQDSQTSSETSAARYNLRSKKAH